MAWATRQSGELPDPGGYAWAYRTGVAPATNMPWMSGLTSFANSLAGQLQQARQFKQQQALAQLKPQATVAAQMPLIQAKGKIQEDIANIRNKGGVARANTTGANQLKLQGLKGQQNLQQTAMKNPGKIMSIVRAQYGLTGDTAKDTQKYGASLPQVQHNAIDTFAKQLGFGGRNDPAFQAIQGRDDFRQATISGMPFTMQPIQPASVPGATSNPATPDVTNPALATGGTDNAPTYP